MPRRDDGAKLSAEIVVLLVGGASDEAIISHCKKAGQSSGNAAKMLADARERIALAARYNPAAELGAAIKRLNQLYAKAMKADELIVALNAQRELNRLLRLGALPSMADDDADDESLKQLDAVRAHLLPLKLTGMEKPIEEHARLAADRIRRASV